MPGAGNPQSLNRYTYVYNNPLAYVDPDGNCPVWFYFVVRGINEATWAMIPNMDRVRRDQVGGSLVTQLSPIISTQASKQHVDPVVLSAILRHESAAVERRTFTLLPTMQPGVLSSAMEAAQVLLLGEESSIGPAQMQVRRARELEQLGYVTPRRSGAGTVSSLLDREGAVHYATGMVRYLSDRLHGIPSFSSLTSEQQQRLLLIGYNLGWDGDKGLRANIEKHGFDWVIDYFDYDNQTLDEYLRWVSR